MSHYSSGCLKILSSWPPTNLDKHKFISLLQKKRRGSDMVKCLPVGCSQSFELHLCLNFYAAGSWQVQISKQTHPTPKCELLQLHCPVEKWSDGMNDNNNNNCCQLWYTPVPTTTTNISHLFSNAHVRWNYMHFKKMRVREVKELARMIKPSRQSMKFELESAWLQSHWVQFPSLHPIELSWWAVSGTNTHWKGWGLKTLSYPVDTRINFTLPWFSLDTATNCLFLSPTPFPAQRNVVETHQHDNKFLNIWRRWESWVLVEITVPVTSRGKWFWPS